MTTTEQIYQIVDKYGANNKQKLMKDLLALRYNVRFETHKKLLKQIRPLIKFSDFEHI